MKRNKLDAAQVWHDIEEHLVPALSLYHSDRSVYFYLVRHSRLAGRRKLDTAYRTLSRGVGLSRSTLRNVLRRLIAKGLIRILDRSYRGLYIEVLLPREIPGCVVERIPAAGASTRSTSIPRTPGAAPSTAVKRAAASTASAASVPARASSTMWFRRRRAAT